MSITSSKPWPLYGYAPGNYICRCNHCNDQFDGDKRSLHCLTCAASMANTELAQRRPAEPDKEYLKSIGYDVFDGSNANISDLWLVQIPRANYLGMALNEGDGWARAINHFKKGWFD